MILVESIRSPLEEAEAVLALREARDPWIRRTKLGSALRTAYLLGSAVPRQARLALHVLINSSAQGQRLIAESQYFDPSWYRERYPDVDIRGINPVLHYILYGAAEGRDPGPRFSTAAYLTMYPDVRERGINPLIHFLNTGRQEGRRAVRPEDFRDAGGDPTRLSVPLLSVWDALQHSDAYDPLPRLQIQEYADRRVNLILPSLAPLDLLFSSSLSCVAANHIANAADLPIRIVSTEGTPSGTILGDIAALTGIKSARRVSTGALSTRTDSPSLPASDADIYISSSLPHLAWMARTLGRGSFLLVLNRPFSTLHLNVASQRDLADLRDLKAILVAPEDPGVMCGASLSAGTFNAFGTVVPLVYAGAPGHVNNVTVPIQNIVFLNRDTAPQLRTSMFTAYAGALAFNNPDIDCSTLKVSLIGYDEQPFDFGEPATNVIHKTVGLGAVVRRLRAADLIIDSGSTALDPLAESILMTLNAKIMCNLEREAVLDSDGSILCPTEPSIEAWRDMIAGYLGATEHTLPQPAQGQRIDWEMTFRGISAALA